jgi:hypothetical protein
VISPVPAMLHKLPIRGPSWLWGITAVAMIVGAAGCSRVPAGIAPVSGRVLLKGQPLAGATVTFQPVGSNADGAVVVGGSVGRTDGEGRFVLHLIDPDVPGAAVGRHVVTITTASLSGDDAARPKGERVPAEWRDGSQTFEVPAGGTAAANFDLP